MLLILTAALLPLGLIAVFASLESAQTNRLRREADARALAATAAQQLSSAVARESLELRTATTELGQTTVDPEQCRQRLDALRRSQRLPVDFALFDPRGRMLCRTAGFSAAPALAPEQIFATEVRLLPAERRLRFEARVAQGAPFGVGEIAVAALTDITRPVALVGQHRMVLREGGNAILLAGDNSGVGPAITVSSPVAGGQVQLELTLTDLQTSAVELLLTLLPLLMWLAAAIIGWAVVNRLLIQPLLQLQAAIGDYRTTDGPLVLPVLATPATEIRGLGAAFQRVTEQLATHEHELEEGLARQTKLTREVHHRVKNNLQVVASLINLHARGVSEPAVADAYASIQRRVDALAVVHRNHYAELEENRGVGLRALIGELAANLRATAPASASHLAITLDLAPLYATQDVAVPIAFLITEIVELAMTCDPTGRIAVVLCPAERDGRATLSVQAEALRDEACRQHPSAERFDRVITGLGRQLRAPLNRDPIEGRFSVEISAHV
ncbi:sensor histidine kinase [Sphingomonas jatrophae]|uniref:histidine kinase n=1 Tax=Sphingomonas jatrophae TaxID=1166337 RepID=A0A1I6JGB1_9SPHN|nr:sensor histidine kinase [Sphingomonas jatrophae]SFR78027.1 Two-component sensor histidine kinase, contains HisKA and HATPase domains [Sphingomonas jatrophae]